MCVLLASEKLRQEDQIKKNLDYIEYSRTVWPNTQVLSKIEGAALGVLWPCNWNFWGWYSVKIWLLGRGYKVSPVIGPLKVVHNVSSAVLSALFKYDTLIPEKAVEEFFLFPFICMSKLRCRASELQKWASSQSRLSLCLCMLCAHAHTYTI